MPIFKCKTCKKDFTARQADRNRGWARFCSKSCKAIKQTQERGDYRKQPSYSKKVRNGKKYKRHDGISEMTHKRCDTCGAPAINGVYSITGEIEWGCIIHHDTTHPFSSEELGQ